MSIEERIAELEKQLQELKDELAAEQAPVPPKQHVQWDFVGLSKLAEERGCEIQEITLDDMASYIKGGIEGLYEDRGTPEPVRQALAKLEAHGIKPTLQDLNQLTLMRRGVQMEAYVDERLTPPSKWIIACPVEGALGGIALQVPDGPECLRLWTELHETAEGNCKLIMQDAEPEEVMNFLVVHTEEELKAAIREMAEVGNLDVQSIIEGPDTPERQRLVFLIEDMIDQIYGAVQHMVEWDDLTDWSLRNYLYTSPLLYSAWAKVEKYHKS